MYGVIVLAGVEVAALEAGGFEVVVVELAGTEVERAVEVVGGLLEVAGSVTAGVETVPVTPVLQAEARAMLPR